jgi:hypothetical protein
MRTTCFSLLAILCLALSATAFAQIFYSEGPIDGNGDAFFITGPNNLDSNGDVQDISNGFVAANSGFPYTLEFGSG